MTEREAGGWREGVNDLLSVEHRQLLVKWLPSPRALFFSCMRDHIKLTVNLCFKVDDLLCWLFLFSCRLEKKIAKNGIFLINEIRREQKSWDKKYYQLAIPREDSGMSKSGVIILEFHLRALFHLSTKKKFF